MARVVIADRRTHVRHALRLLLEVRCGCTVIGEVARADVLPTVLQSGHPDLLLLDCDLTPLQNRRYFHALRTDCPGLYIIILGSSPEPRDHALRSGADAFIDKGNGPDAVLAVLADVLYRVD